MFKQYFGIILLYFSAGACTGQITCFTVISGPDIKTLSNKIQDRKNEGLTYHILDSLAKRPQSPNWTLAPNGDIVKTITKNNALFLTRSKDGGKTWANEVFIDSLFKAKKNPFAKVNDCAFIACNYTMGRMYVCWSDAKFGIKNNDLFLSYSDDGGKTWLDRILITYYPNHKQQFMPRFAMDHNNGYLYFMYCSQRNFAKGNLTDVYLAASRDNGKTFYEYKLNNAPFEWRDNASLNKYFSLVVKDGSIYPIWMQTDPHLPAGKAGKKLVVYSTVLNEQILGEVAYTEKIVLDKNVTYTYSSKTSVNYNGNPGPHTVYLYKANDPEFEAMVIGPQPKAGSRSFTIDFEKLKLPKATYVAMLYNNEGANYVWIQEE
jgi:Neuraminidase (sialidase)